MVEDGRYISIRLMENSMLNVKGTILKKINV